MTNNFSIIISDKKKCDKVYKFLSKKYNLSIQKFHCLDDFRINFPSCLSLIITDFDVNRLSDFLGIKIIKINEEIDDNFISMVDLEIKKLKETKTNFNDLLIENTLKLEIKSNRFNIENLDNLIFHLLNKFLLNMALELKYSISTILKETITNAFYHGNFQIDSNIKSKENGFIDFYNIVEEKQNDKNFNTKKVFVSLKLLNNKVLISVKDEGKGFNSDKIKYKENKVYGRGLKLIELNSDSIDWNKKGNEIIIEKRINE